MTDSRLVLVGGGDFARELLGWLLHADPHLAGRLPIGFIDDGVDQLQAGGLAPTSLGTISTFRPQAGDQLLMAIAAPTTRRRLHALLRERGARFSGFRHPSAVVAATARLGEGVVLCPFSLVSEATTLGDQVIVNSFSSVGHDAVIGAFSTLSAHVDVTGHARIGEEVLMGSGARVLPGKRVGARAVVGAGATVMRHLAAGHTLYAPPSRIL
ncbi:MAG: NeuD/PglB/VioB family sugar acetyltransferase [Prochlorococcaceae cyanobacterium]